MDLGKLSHAAPHAAGAGCGVPVLYSGTFPCGRSCRLRPSLQTIVLRIHIFPVPHGSASLPRVPPCSSPFASSQDFPVDSSCSRAMHCSVASSCIAAHLTSPMFPRPSVLRRASSCRMHLVDRALVSPTRRWCPLCWAHDPEPYDRKAWWLAVVDACPVHGCLLESRCGTCGRLQPSLTRGVRLTACS